MTLHLTAAEWERIVAAGSGVLFREGGIATSSLDDKGTWTDIPPAEFVEAAAARIDGKRRVAAVVPCGDQEAEPCDFIGVLTDGTEQRFIHHTCNGTGFVTVGHVVVTWGPLVVVDIRRYDGGPAVVIHYDGSAWLTTEGRLDRLTLPPDVDPQSLVGQYALGVERVR